MKRLVIATTHPIQYQAPWFRHLREQLEGWVVHVMFLSLPDARAQAEGFGGAFTWDQPLLEGYDYSVAQSVKGSASLATFTGLRLTAPRRELRALRPTAVLLLGWQCLGLVQLLWAAKTLRVPLLLRGESSGLYPRRGWRAWLLRRLCCRANAILYIGEANRRFYQQLNISDMPMWRCPYFVDQERFAGQAGELASQRSALRDRWHIPPQAFCFLFVGKFIEKKRLFDALQALKHLSQSPDISVYLLAVGRGEQERQARAWVSKHHLPVTFAGFLNQSEIVQAYVAADALLLPSDYGETWGLVVNEAMACARPAIVSDHAGCHLDLIRTGQTGYVSRFGDIEDLADCMRRLAAEPLAAQQMGQGARTLVMSDYSMMQASAGLAQALDGVIATRGTALV